MGCTQSTSDHELTLDGLERSFMELSIAKRPGGPDVGPNRTTPSKSKRLSDGSTLEETAAEEEPAPEPSAKNLPTGVIEFSVVKVVADEDGVMFYHFNGMSLEDPKNEIQIAKRYLDFKALHAEISELMASERHVSAAQQHLFETHPALPEMPKANVWTYLRGRYNEKVLEEREQQFTRILNAISRHPVESQSRVFTNFLL